MLIVSVKGQTESSKSGNPWGGEVRGEGKQYEAEFSLFYSFVPLDFYAMLMLLQMNRKKEKGKRGRKKLVEPMFIL